MQTNAIEMLDNYGGFFPKVRLPDVGYGQVYRLAQEVGDAVEETRLREAVTSFYERLYNEVGDVEWVFTLAAKIITDLAQESITTERSKEPRI